MIISASRRTDICAYYSDWFFNRLKAGYAFVRNPFNYKQVKRVALTPEDVECIVFWSKNPAPMLPNLGKLKGFTYYFQFTLNGYGKDMEANISHKNSIYTFKTLSDKISPERVIWRYDPIMLYEKYTADYHIHQFELIANSLRGFTKKCIISFVDMYRGTVRNLPGLSEAGDWDKRIIAKKIAEIAKSCGMNIFACAEETDFSDLGVARASCVDGKFINELTGMALDYKKDKNQRSACLCAESIDIGAYNSCPGGCKYCYANYSSAIVKKNVREYDPNSPLLCSRLTGEDRFTKNAERGQNY